MALYQLHYKANPVLWPSDPKENLAMWEETSQAAENLLASGTMHDLHLVTPTEGYARVKAESKTAALAIAASFSQCSLTTSSNSFHGTKQRTRTRGGTSSCRTRMTA